MKQYRIGYDYLFLPNSSFSYKGDFIGSMSVYVLFKIFNTKGKEILFKSDDLMTQKLSSNNVSCYMQDLISCSFDRKNILTFEPNILLLKKFDGNLQVEWEIDSYSKDIDKGILEPEIITEAEFMDILKNNLHAFDNSNNRPAQSTSYFTQEIGKSDN